MKSSLRALVAVLLTACSLDQLAAQELKDPAKPPPAADKRFALHLDAQPWPKVMALLSDMSGLPVISRQLPPGTLSFQAPKGRLFTLGEVIDVLNDSLQAGGYLIIRRDASLVVVAADEKVPPALIPVVPLAELPQRGRTELVRLILPASQADLKEALPGLKRVLGPFGEATLVGQQLMLTDNAGNLRQLLPLLRDLAPPVVTEIIHLHALEPARAANLVRGMFGAGQGPFIASDPNRNALVVRGTRAQLDEITAVLRALGEGAPQPGGVRIITLEQGSAAILAESLQNLLQKIGRNPVKVVVPGKEPPPPPKEAPLKDPGKPEAGKPGRPPLNVTAFGQRLILQSDDPEALALAQEVARLLLGAGVGDLEVIRLKHGPAANVAKVIDELYNPRGAGAKARLRVVADPFTNSLLIQATPLDMQAIRRLLATELDRDADAAPVLRYRTIGPLEFVQAAEIAKVLRDVFKDAPATPFSVGADARNNTLIIRCTQPVEAEVRALVKELDKKTAK